MGFIPIGIAFKCFKWVGPTVNKSLPSFFFDEVKTEHFGAHFKALNVTAGQVTLVFLNQVAGETPGGRGMLFDNMNVRDGEFQSGARRPDSLLFPKAARDHLVEVKCTHFPTEHLTGVTTGCKPDHAIKINQEDWSKCRRPIALPSFLDQGRKKKRANCHSNSIKSPAWASPPRIGTFHRNIDCKFVRVLDLPACLGSTFAGQNKSGGAANCHHPTPTSFTSMHWSSWLS
jgi:hypothetical protein